jgi:hypothetical protein
MEAMRGVAPVRDLPVSNGYVGDTEELVRVRLTALGAGRRLGRPRPIDALPLGR